MSLSHFLLYGGAGILDASPGITECGYKKQIFQHLCYVWSAVCSIFTVAIIYSSKYLVSGSIIGGVDATELMEDSNSKPAWSAPIIQASAGTLVCKPKSAHCLELMPITLLSNLTNERHVKDSRKAPASAHIRKVKTVLCISKCHKQWTAPIPWTHRRTTTSTKSTSNLRYALEGYTIQ